MGIRRLRMKKIYGVLLFIWVLTGLTGCGGGGDSPGILFPTPDPSPTGMVTGTISVTLASNPVDMRGVTLYATDNPAFSPAHVAGSAVITDDGSGQWYSMTVPAGITGLYFYASINGSGPVIMGNTPITGPVSGGSVIHDISYTANDLTTISGNVTYTVNSATADPNGMTLEARDNAAYVSGNPLGSTTVAGGTYSMPISTPGSNTTVYFFLGDSHAPAGSVPINSGTTAVPHNVTCSRTINTVISGTVTYTINSVTQDPNGLAVEVRDNASYGSGNPLGSATVSGTTYSVSFTAPTTGGTTAYFFIGPNHEPAGSQAIAAFAETAAKDLSYTRTINTTISGSVTYTVNSVPADPNGETLEIRDNAAYVSGTQLGTGTVSGGTYSISISAPVTAAKTVYFFLGPEHLSAGSVSVGALATTLTYDVSAAKTTGGGITTISGNITLASDPIDSLFLNACSDITVRDGLNNLLGILTPDPTDFLNMGSPVFPYTADIPTPADTQEVYFKIMEGATTVSSVTIQGGETTKTHNFTPSCNTTTVTGTLTYEVNGASGDPAHDFVGNLMLSTSPTGTTTGFAGIVIHSGGTGDSYTSAAEAGGVFKPDFPVTVYLFTLLGRVGTFSFTLNSSESSSFGPVTWDRSAITVSGSISGNPTDPNMGIWASTSPSYSGNTSSLLGIAYENLSDGSYFINIDGPSSLPQTPQTVYFYTPVSTEGSYVPLGSVKIPLGTTAGNTLNCNLTIP
jgi:hypothetical protein